MKKGNQFWKILAALVGGILGYAVVSSMYEAGRSTSATKDFLTRAAIEVNKKLPMPVDAETRLDMVEAGPGNIFTYDYSLPNKSKAEVDIQTLRQSLRLQIIENYKTSGQMKSFRDRNIEVHYKYKDKNGEFAFEIIASPKDF